MARLLVQVEGQTEEEFVRSLLEPHLRDFGHSVAARMMGKPSERARRGGVIGWPSARADLLGKLHESDLFVTTMVDFYAMPASPPNGWPGRAGATGSSDQKARCVQTAMLADVAATMGGSFDPARFIPYVSMHEFEALLFSDPPSFAVGLDEARLESDFRQIVSSFESPEEINDSAVTAPSKRIQALVPGYQKPLFGNVAALSVGLEVMRRSCPNFKAWLCRLEALPQL